MKSAYLQPFLLLIFIGLGGCFNKLSPGVYQSSSKSGILMAGKTLTIIDEKGFEYKFWSDDIASNRIGHGTYHISGNELILQFEEFPPLENLVASEMITAEGNFLEYRFAIKDNNDRPLIGVMVELLDNDGNALKQGITDLDGKCILVLGKNNLPLNAKTHYLGMLQTDIHITNEQAIQFTIQLAEKTQYIEAGTVYRFRGKVKNRLLILKKENGKIEKLKRK